MGNTKNSFSHVKIVFAGLLSTKSLVRNTALIIFNADYDNELERENAIMDYFHSLGVPDVPTLTYDDFRPLVETVLSESVEEVLEGDDDSPFPINIDYDQNNCQYNALISHAISLDKQAGPFI